VHLKIKELEPFKDKSAVDLRNQIVLLENELTRIKSETQQSLQQQIDQREAISSQVLNEKKLIVSIKKEIIALENEIVT